MRRYRRLVLIDRLIPFLAAIVGLVALAGAVAVHGADQAEVVGAGGEVGEEVRDLHAGAAVAGEGPVGAFEVGLDDALLAVGVVGGE